MFLRTVITAITCGLLFFTAFTKNAAPGNLELAEPLLPEYRLHHINTVMEAGKMAKLTMGFTQQGRKIEAWYFPGTSSYRALVIGGVHGSELSAIEVAQQLVKRLLNGSQPYYSVIVIPCLFPDNAATAIRNPAAMGSVLNIGRYSNASAPDPNRQMPSPGKAFDENTGVDHMGRVIEWENQLLLQLIESFKPSRIASVHAIRNTGYGGIYADPRTDHLGLAKGYDTDSSLAVEMAFRAAREGGNVKGNTLHKKPNALYYKDPKPAAKGQFQKRNMTGSILNGHRGSGVSLGTWGTTAIAWEDDPAANRDAMRVITMEMPGAKRPGDYQSEPDRRLCDIQVKAYAAAIHEVFLDDRYLE